MAEELGVRFDLLLGFATAHEIGHCLLGPDHSPSLLMRPVWKRQDAASMNQLSLSFSKQEGERMVERLRRGLL
jgi:hypothetical protein